MVVDTVKVGSRTYEQRWNLCGKKTCTVCYPPHEVAVGRCGHGPYWYLCLQHGRRWLRLYIGKVLNTERYIKGDGTLDWEMVRREKSDRQQRARERRKKHADTASIER
jgi:hypothetical protein